MARVVSTCAPAIETIIIEIRGVASLSNSRRPGGLSCTHIVKIARMTSTHGPHQHYELLSFLAHPNNA